MSGLSSDDCFSWANAARLQPAKFFRSSRLDNLGPFHPPRKVALIVAISLSALRGANAQAVLEELTSLALLDRLTTRLPET